MFAEVDVFPRYFRKKRGKAVVRNFIADQEIRKEFGAEMRSYIKKRYFKDPELSSFHVQTTLFSIPIYSLICFKRDDDLFNSFGPAYQNALRLFALYHETGHALIQEGDPVDKTHPYQECAADAYAALRFFQKFGQEAVPVLSMWSWMRAYDAIAYDHTKHLTTTVLDKIIADGAAENYFSGLTPPEIVDRARSYAEEWTPSPETLAAARGAFKGGGLKKYDLVSKTCLASPDKFTFYIGAKIFQPLLHSEGVRAGDKIYQIPDAEKHKYTAMIATRAEAMTLSDVFNKNAARAPAQETSAIEMLKVHLPQGQHRLVFNL